MKWINLFVVVLFFSFTSANAQDAILISEGNFIRGVIKGTNFSSVALVQEDQTIVQYQAKDIQSFVWNGETYASKPIVVKKKMEYRFFKVIETGAVNLYAYGETAATEQVAQPRVKVRPSFGVGVGTGGFGGGLGGGISIGGGGRRNEEPVNNAPRGKVSYFLEKPGTGPMQEVSLEAGKTAEVKKLLLQKLNNDEDLAESINATDSFDIKNLTAYIKSYNVGHK
ncbi:hypothetical protein [Pedobacter sp. Hv1]|uniref:hypothetical protein n=1 Tax=Pedobacter sp. Hv1 TaxID=1740090 RepID=UPI0006D8A814|nr:hypothetical protein [Pedobacter sp. Hv1]KQB98857.1 hypothetical protein AQF98_21195 [Pedobacter sp. Hv1]